jgi:hypothetical protein
MIIILETEREAEFMKTRMEVMQMANYVLAVKDETYVILKDRYTGYRDIEFPLDELPEVVKRRISRSLQFRDNICTVEEEND